MSQVILSIGYYRDDDPKTPIADIDTSQVSSALIALVVAGTRVRRGKDWGDESGLDIRYIDGMPKGVSAVGFAPVKYRGAPKMELTPLLGLLGLAKRKTYRGLIQTMWTFQGYPIDRVTESGVVTTAKMASPVKTKDVVLDMYNDRALRQALWGIVKPLEDVEDADYMAINGCVDNMVWKHEQIIKAHQVHCYRTAEARLWV